MDLLLRRPASLRGGFEARGGWIVIHRDVGGSARNVDVINSAFALRIRVDRIRFVNENLLNRSSGGRECKELRGCGPSDLA